ncbi:MAG: YdcF family protein [Eubacterium sp.]|nr:YdcF family protein [Eubacterium sp.]
MRLKKMGKYQKIVFALGILVIVYALDYWRRSNFNIGNFLILAVGIIMALWYFVPETRAVIWLKRLILAGFGVYFALAAFIFVMGKTETADFTEEAAVVLGCGVKGTKLTVNLKQRLDKACEYYEENPGCIICVTGGQGPQEDIAEGEAMGNYLEEQGIPFEKIIRETQASSTEENFAFSKELLDDYFENEDYSVVYITNDFHSYRAGLYAEETGFYEVHSFSAPSSIRSLLPNYMREVLAVAEKWVLDSVYTSLA